MPSKKKTKEVVVREHLRRVPIRNIMKNLIRNSFVVAFLTTFISGCQNSKIFEMRTLKNQELHIVDTSSNRIIHECYFMNAEKENNWRYQYILTMLNEKNEAIPVYNPTNQGKEECLDHLKKVEKVLRTASRVKLCVRDQLEKVTVPYPIPKVHDFGILGKYKSHYHALTFDRICNTKDCYGISDTWTYTCAEL